MVYTTSFKLSYDARIIPKSQKDTSFINAIGIHLNDIFGLAIRWVPVHKNGISCI